MVSPMPRREGRCQPPGTFSAATLKAPSVVASPDSALGTPPTRVRVTARARARASAEARVMVRVVVRVMVRGHGQGHG